MDRRRSEGWLDAYKRAGKVEARRPRLTGRATTGSAGIARWHCRFTKPTSNSAVELGAGGKCTEFREWWHKIG